MDAQRKLRNLLSYTKTDSVEELEDCNKLYEELLEQLNKQEKFTELLGVYQQIWKIQNQDELTISAYTYEDLIELINKKETLEKELEEMK